MKIYRHHIIFILFAILSCKPKKPCSPIDSSCNPLGYILPDLIINNVRKSNTPNISTGTNSNTGTITFTGLKYLTILSATSVRLDWEAATSTTSGSIEYNIYSASISGGQNFSTPLQTLTNVTTATITGITASTNNYYVVRAKDASGKVDTNTNERAALFNGLIRFIPLDSSALATGEKIGGGAVTAFGTPSATSADRKGTVNNAYTLNGSSQHFEFSQTTPVALPTGNSNKTVCAWLRTNSSAFAQTFFGYGQTNGQQANYYLQHTAPNYYFTYDQYSSFSVQSPVFSNVTYTNWNFSCISYNTTGSLFGFLLNENYAEAVNSLATMNSLNNSPATIGKFSFTPPLSNYFNGSIAEVSFWNRTLTKAEMLTISKN
ncbi:MAG: LamG-like jellyroll fold domain-containing protein [Leptospiraceae bacterium]|nr:LamG-like jellyroll fold domain-containing protein [Leptospiraceae bacterium]